MSTVPAELKYSTSHEWVKDNGDGTVTVGITDHAQDALGDLVFVELPEVGRAVAVEEACAVVESVKAASDIYSPLTGEVTEINADLVDAPETINQDPYATGWIFKLRLADAGELGSLLDADAYARIADEH
jgi:glycine cleavage system H protein